MADFLTLQDLKTTTGAVLLFTPLAYGLQKAADEIRSDSILGAKCFKAAEYFTTPLDRMIQIIAIPIFTTITHILEIHEEFSQNRDLDRLKWNIVSSIIILPAKILGKTLAIGIFVFANGVGNLIPFKLFRPFISQQPSDFFCARHWIRQQLDTSFDSTINFGKFASVLTNWTIHTDKKLGELFFEELRDEEVELGSTRVQQPIAVNESEEDRNIRLGAECVRDIVKASTDANVKQAFIEEDPDLYEFVLLQIVIKYVIGQKEDGPVPVFFTKNSIDEIKELRKDKEFKDLQMTNLPAWAQNYGDFQNESKSTNSLTGNSAKARQLRGIAYKEQQGGLLTKYWPAAKTLMAAKT